MNSSKMVGMVEIAGLLGVKRQLVANWRLRYPDFPVPDLQLEAGPLWIWDQLEAWARRKNMYGELVSRNSNQVGNLFTNEEICAFHHCEPVPYLRKSGGRIVCGCFGLDLNPNTPYQILVEDTPNRVEKANEVVRQGIAIPCYSKLDVNQWRYEGLFFPVSFITDESTVLPLAEEAQRKKVAGLLTFRKID